MIKNKQSVKMLVMEVMFRLEMIQELAGDHDMTMMSMSARAQVQLMAGLLEGESANK